ncbi:hypothetical protein TomTYG75_09400 [Sphingobium sp. TomTYG75]
MTETKTLVNFNVPTTILQTFDKLCRLYGKPRSQILNELLYGYILEFGQQAFSRFDQVRKIDESLNTAFERSDGTDLDDLPPKAENDVQNGLKRKFSSFGRKDEKPSEAR